MNPRVRGYTKAEGGRDIRLTFTRLPSQSGPRSSSADFKETSRLIITITSRVPPSHVRFYERDAHGAAATAALETGKKRETAVSKATRLIS